MMAVLGHLQGTYMIHHLLPVCSGFNNVFSTIAQKQHSRLLNRFLAFPVVLGLYSSLATAQQTEHESSSTWGVGAVVLSSQKAYTDVDRNNTFVPIVTFENKYIRLLGPELEFKLPGIELNELGQLNFSLVTKYDFNDYEQDDSWILNEMDKRKGGFWAGAKAEWQNRYVNISAEFTSEISGDSEGSRVEFGLERTWRFGEQFTLTPRMTVSWLDKKYVDYYYGVRADEVRSYRAFYQGQAGMNAEIGIRGGYMFNKKHLILLDVGLSSLASEVKDSPLVDNSTENRVFLGYIYYFR